MLTAEVLKKQNIYENDIRILRKILEWISEHPMPTLESFEKRKQFLDIIEKFDKALDTEERKKFSNLPFGGDFAQENGKIIDAFNRAGEKVLAEVAANNTDCDEAAHLLERSYLIPIVENTWSKAGNAGHPTLRRAWRGWKRSTLSTAENLRKTRF